MRLTAERPSSRDTAKKVDCGNLRFSRRLWPTYYKVSLLGTPVFLRENQISVSPEIYPVDILPLCHICPTKPFVTLERDESPARKQMKMTRVAIPPRARPQPNKVTRSFTHHLASGMPMPRHDSSRRTQPPGGCSMHDNPVHHALHAPVPKEPCTSFVPHDATAQERSVAIHTKMPQIPSSLSKGLGAGTGMHFNRSHQPKPAISNRLKRQGCSPSAGSSVRASRTLVEERPAPGPQIGQRSDPLKAD